MRVRGPLREVGERVVKGGDLRGRDQRGTSLSSGAPAMAKPMPVWMPVFMRSCQVGAGAFSSAACSFVGAASSAAPSSPLVLTSAPIVGAGDAGFGANRGAVSGFCSANFHVAFAMGGSIYLVAAVPWAILAPMNLIKLLLNKARLHTPQT